MSFESVYRSKTGVTELNKVATMIGSLVIKNQYEAQLYETSQSLSNYIKYHGAYTQTDSFADYSLDERREYNDAVHVIMSKLNGNRYVYNKGLLNTLCESRISTLEERFKAKDLMTIDYLIALRYCRTQSYNEENSYYRQFLGKSEPNDEKIYILNMDVGENGYVKVDDLSTSPMKDLDYYTKVLSDGEYVYKNLGTLESWYNDDSSLIAENFYYAVTMYVEDINKTLTPKTYNYFILQQHIDEIIDEYPTKYYLRFIGKEYSPYYIRNLPNYSIIQYNKTIMSGVEQSYFFKSYEKAKKQVLLDYIKGFDSKQPLYNLLMIQNLLYYTVINYSASYIERYSLGIYSEENCNDILDSYGYSSLKSIKDLELKQRIVRNLNDLISNKGNNYILDLILNKILQDPTSELKRYYLEKQYTINTDNSIKINTAAGLESSVKLIFREVPALSLNTLSTTEDKYHDYDNFIWDDNLWGGISDTDTDQSKLTKKNYIKYKLLSSNFNSILTKYITLTKSIDLLDAQRQLRDSIYLMLKYFDEHESEAFFKQKVDFESFSATPSALFAMICWLQQMKTFKNPDTILYDNCVINNSVVFRRMGELAVDKATLENNTFVIDGKPVVVYDITPEIANWKVVDFIKENKDLFEDNDTYSEYVRNFFKNLKSNNHIPSTRLTDLYDSITNEKIEDGILTYEYIEDDIKYMEPTIENIEDYLTRFRFFENGIDLGEITSNTTFEDLLTDYKNQYPNLIRRITEKMQKCYDYREFQAWAYLLELSRTDNSIGFIFKGYKTFSDYIHSVESDTLVDYVFSNLKSYQPIADSYTNGELSIGVETYKKIHNTEYRISDICAMQNELTDLFKEWVTANFSELVYSSDENEETDSFSTDMKLLFDEFLSVFSQLYTVDYNYSFGNKEYDGLFLQLFYNPLALAYRDKYTDNLDLRYLIKFKYKDTYSFTMNMWDNLSSKIRVNDMIANINNDIKYDSETNEYKIDDQFLYELSLYFSSILRDYVGYNDKINKILVKDISEDKISFQSKLEIKSEQLGDKTYYEKNS